MQKFIANAQDATFGIECHLGVMYLAALVRGGHEVLGAILDPLDWSPQLQGRPGHQNFLGVEHHDLRTKATANEGGNHPHLAFAQSQRRRQAVAHEHRCLRGIPQGQPIGAHVPLGYDAASLDRR